MLRLLSFTLPGAWARSSRPCPTWPKELSSFPWVLARPSLPPLSGSPPATASACQGTALILASFGNLSQAKMNVEAIEAYAAIRSEIPPSLMIFAGQDWEQGLAAARVKQLGLEDHVRFLGRQDEADFLDLIAACDIGISLRRPPTYGETSAALLDLFRTGIPTIVTDTDTFSDYPDTIVRKVDWERDGLSGLVRAMRRTRDAAGLTVEARAGSPPSCRGTSHVAPGRRALLAVDRTRS